MRSSRKLEISPEADDDLRSLLANSLVTWGKSQLAVYAERLAATSNEVLLFPMGRPTTATVLIVSR